MLPDMRRHIWMAVLGLQLLGSLVLAQSGGGSPAQPPSPFKSKLLRVGVTPDSPPLIFKAGSSYEGVEIDFARLLGKELDRPVAFVSLPWDEQIDALKDGKIDIIMSGMTVTREREEDVAFSPPYLNFGQMAMVRQQDRARFTSVRTLLDTTARVAVIPETTGAAFVKENFENANVIEFETPDSAVDAVVRSNADVFIYDSPVILWLSGKREMENVAPVTISLTIEYLAWAMRPDDEQLQQEVADALLEFEQDGRLQTVLDRWLPDRR